MLAVIHQVGGHDDLLLHHIRKRQHSPIRVTLKDTINDALVRDLWVTNRQNIGRFLFRRPTGQPPAALPLCRVPTTVALRKPEAPNGAGLVTDTSYCDTPSAPLTHLVTSLI
jgi:hypothetical protein